MKDTPVIGLSIFFCLIIIYRSSLGIAETVTFTNTNDAGAGLLRQTVADANIQPGADTILFNIATSGSQYNPANCMETIKPLTSLPSLTDNSTVINGNSQTSNQGDTNPQAADIEIDSSDIAGSGIIITKL